MLNSPASRFGAVRRPGLAKIQRLPSLHTNRKPPPPPRAPITRPPSKRKGDGDESGSEEESEEARIKRKRLEADDGYFSEGETEYVERSEWDREPVGEVEE